MRDAKLARIQYWGEAGITQTCLDAVVRLLQYNDQLSKVHILTSRGRHGLLITVEPIELIAVKSGFASGYTGEGPRKFSYALALLMEHGINIDEFEINNSMLERLDHSALTTADVQEIKALNPVRPLRIYEYIETQHFDAARVGDLWKEFRPVIPYAIIDPRIIDLAVSFWQHPDTNLMDGYRRFEDAVRLRTGSYEIGAKLFTEAFLKQNSRLSWNGISEGEQKARANIIINAYSAYRNPRAHKERQSDSQEYLSEFLLLNHLFRLESESTNSTS